MPYHPVLTDDGRNAICIFCNNYISISDSEGVIEFGILLHCGHLFGSVCLEHWMETSELCPTCRTPTTFRFRLLSSEEFDMLRQAGSTNIDTAQAIANDATNLPTDVQGIGASAMETLAQMPHWLRSSSPNQTLQDVLNALTLLSFRNVHHRAHRAAFPRLDFVTIMALYTSEEVHEIDHLIGELELLHALTVADVGNMIGVNGMDAWTATEDAQIYIDLLDTPHLHGLIMRPLNRVYIPGIEAFVPLHGSTYEPIADSLDRMKPIDASLWHPHYTPPTSTISTAGPSDAQEARR